MNFDDLTDIVIPEGNVIKIQETIGGRVLWEKKKILKPRWVKFPWEAFSWNFGNANNNLRLIQLAFGTQNVSGYSPPSDSSGYMFFKAIIRSSDNTRHFITYDGSLGLSSFFDNDGRILLKSDYGVSQTAKAQSDERDVKYYAMSDDGCLVFYYDAHSNVNEFRIRYDAKKNTQFIKVNSYVSEDNVFITHSPQRSEYLVTGISGGTFVLPENFSPSFSINQNKQTLSKSIWVAHHNRYYAITGNDRFIQYSDDGYSWNSSQAFYNGKVSDLVFLYKKGLLCAINANKAKIALSSDGLNWKQLDVPFSNSLACAYSPDFDAICIVDSLAAYVSHDFSHWEKADLPNINVNFRELIHSAFGVFIGYSRMSTNAWALVLDN